MFTGEDTIHPIPKSYPGPLPMDPKSQVFCLTQGGSLAPCASEKCSSAENRKKKGRLNSATNTAPEKAYLEDEFPFQIRGRYCNLTVDEGSEDSFSFLYISKTVGCTNSFWNSLGRNIYPYRTDAERAQVVLPNHDRLPVFGFCFLTHS